MKRFWADYTSQEFAQLDHDRVIAVLPVGAIEQHGPHLPLAVDFAVADGFAKRLAEALPDTSPVIILPTQPVGKSDEHLAFSGSLTLSAETLARVWAEIGASVARSGVRKIVLLNSHGGQISTMDIVARDLRIKHKMLAFSVNWFGFGLPDGLYSDDEKVVGIHAGDLETSIMLAMHPELVDMSKARDFRPLTDTLIRDFSHIRVGGGAKLGWQAHDMNAAGACGNASLATPQKGQETIDFVMAKLIEVFDEIDRADLDWLNNTPEW